MTNNKEQTYFVIYEGLEENSQHSIRVEIKPFNDDLKYLQSLVGGYIEHVTLTPELNDRRIDMWVDEEGLIKELTPTISLMRDGETVGVICGNCVFSKYTDDGYTFGLNEDEVQIVIEWLLSLRRASLEYQGRHVAAVVVWER